MFLVAPGIRRQGLWTKPALQTTNPLVSFGDSISCDITIFGILKAEALKKVYNGIELITRMLAFDRFIPDVDPLKLSILMSTAPSN